MYGENAYIIIVTVNGRWKRVYDGAQQINWSFLHT